MSYKSPEQLRAELEAEKAAARRARRLAAAAERNPYVRRGSRPGRIARRAKGGGDSVRSFVQPTRRTGGGRG